MTEKIKVVLGQLGSPKAPTAKELRPYLRDFLGDPRVVDLNPLLWKPILYLLVLTFRPRKSAKAYARIWDGSSFPLVALTKILAEKIQAELPDYYEVDAAFLLGKPQIEDLFAAWDQEDFWTRAQKVLVLPQFPQYAESTIASVVDKLGASLGNRVNIPHLEFVSYYHRAKCFIDNTVLQIETSLAEFTADGKEADALVLSFHGIPLRRVLDKKDLYYQHCFETYYLIKQKLNHPLASSMHLCFQSRFGSEQWLGPATDDYVLDLIEKGEKKIAISCPSFTVDCLETIDEIGYELGKDAKEEGGEVLFIPCLNVQDKWVKDYSHFIRVHCEGNFEEKKNLFHHVEREEIERLIPMQKPKSESLPKKSKRIVGLMFFVLFLDLVGFSLIFPLFPALAQYYLEIDPQNTWLQAMLSPATYFFPLQALGTSEVVLFGSVMGALFAFLQFIAAPFWGTLSDKIGRRPVLLVSIGGLAVSYLFWIFAQSFELLIAGRILGGLMAGNISTATAVVGDVTSRENRSKGMAVVGIAFALGFILGPAMGGLFSLIRLDLVFPQVWGLNPFSAPAVLAMGLGLLNFYLVSKKFPETLPAPSKKTKAPIPTTYRSANPLKLFRSLGRQKLALVNLSYFFFITVFSGMEFTLTFLAVERMGLDPLENGLMFVFIGLVLAFVQGGFVRRYAHKFGEKNLALWGLLLIAPGLVLMAFAQNLLVLYGGLFFLATGSALIIPTLTAMVSLYSPAEKQGQTLGVFRSLGSLGRVFGPLSAGLIYWRLSAEFLYLTGAVALVIPIALLLFISNDEG